MFILGVIAKAIAAASGPDCSLGDGDLSGLSYASKNFSTATEITAMLGIWSDEGQTVCYALNGEGFGGDDFVYKYDFGTSGDISSLAVDTGNEININTDSNNARGMWLNEAEDTMLVGSLANDSIKKYALSTAGDLTSATFTAGQEVDVSTEVTNIVGLATNSDMSTIFALDNAAFGGNGVLQAYTLSTAGDFSTGSVDTGNVYDYTTEETGNMAGVYFHPDGKILYMAGQGADVIHTYTLSTAWDLTTITYEGTTKDLDTSGETGNPNGGLWVACDETKVFSGGSNETINQYD